MFEGRDHTSGDSFIMTATQDIYINAEDYAGGGGHFCADHPRRWPPDYLLWIIAPHSGHLRNFFLTAPTEMLSFFQEVREAA